tara:strand:- start:633 stop:848 length:216 start_codon:yes stop_codon:yes gene_type:complete
MVKNKTLWQRLKPEHKQEVKDFKNEYKNSGSELIASLKKNIFWVDLRYVDGMNITEICKTPFLGDVFIENK